MGIIKNITSGTNTGDETNATIKTKLGTDLSNKLDYNGDGSSLTGLTQAQISGLTTSDTATFKGVTTQDGAGGYTQNIVDTSGARGIGVFQTDSDTSTLASYFKCMRKKTTGGAVESGNFLGSLVYAAYYNSTQQRNVGGLIVTASENHSSTSGGSEMIFQTTANGATSVVNRWKVSNAGHLLPVADNAYTLGASGARPSALWAVTGTIQTSDGRQKENILPIKDVEKLDLFFDKLNPVSYKWKNYIGQITSYETDENGESVEVVSDKEYTFKRLHHGMIAQEVESAMATSGITSEEFAGLIKDSETGEYGLRYEEFIPMLIAQVQALKNEVKNLKTQLEA